MSGFSEWMLLAGQAFADSYEQGLIYGIVALGVYISFRVIDFPDLTVDGTFPLGAGLSAALTLAGVHPALSLLCAAGAGALGGIVTGYLNIRFKILGLLAGILTMTGLYSVNLRVMGSPNLSLFTAETLFERWSFANAEPVIIFLASALACALVIRFLKSERGLAVRAVGSNAIVSRALGVNVGAMTLLALAISNGLVAFAGGLFAQHQEFADANLGIGTIIIGLASVIIGEAVFHSRKLHIAVISAMLGSLLYHWVLSFALNFSDIGFRPSDFKLLTAVLITVALLIPRAKQTIKARRQLG